MAPHQIHTQAYYSHCTSAAAHCSIIITSSPPAWESKASTFIQFTNEILTIISLLFLRSYLIYRFYFFSATVLHHIDTQTYCSPSTPAATQFCTSLTSLLPVWVCGNLEHQHLYNLQMKSYIASPLWWNFFYVFAVPRSYSRFTPRPTIHTAHPPSHTVLHL